MALNPEDIDLMGTDAMAAKAEEALRERQASLAKEDFSDMVAEHAAKQSNKRKRIAEKDGGRDKGSKKYKEFKF
jgi:splicing factor 3B subunit 2